MLTLQSPEVKKFMRERDAMMAENAQRIRFKITPHRPVWEVLRDGEWAGERCFIIGGGPSLEGFNFERLRGKGRIIVINAAYLDVPFADVLFFMDGSKTTFYGLVHNGRLKGRPDCLEAWNNFAGHKVFLNLLGRQYDDVHSVRSIGRMGLSHSLRNGLYHGNNAGMGAIGLAACLHANPIYLLGIDCKFTGGKTHYHGKYPATMQESVFRSFIRDFERLDKFIQRTQFKVVNLNPDSGVRCFPFSTADEVLGNGKVSEPTGMDQTETTGL